MNIAKAAHPARIDVIDYARFAAAVFVMLFHYSYIGIKYGATGPITYLETITDIGKYGYLGVELFFMISGFVIFTSSQERTASQFIVARALRLYPAFVFCVVLTGLVTFLFGGPVSHITLSQFVANFSMFAPAFNEKHVDASYWTLGVELKFYAIIFILILLGFSRHLGKFFLAWAVAIMVASIGNLNAVPALSGYCSYFCAGTLFAMRMRRKSWSIDVLLSGCLYYSLQFSCIKSPEIKEVYPLSTAIIAAFICAFYLFFWALSSGILVSRKLPAARQLGMVTYPLYLVHQSIGHIIIRHFSTEQNKIAVIGGTMIAMILLGFIVHHCAEVKLFKFWKFGLDALIGQPVAWCDSRIIKVKLRLRTLASPS